MNNWRNMNNQRNMSSSEITKIIKEIHTLDQGISEVEEYLTFLYRERRKHQPYNYKMDSGSLEQNQKILQTRSIITMIDNTIKETKDTHLRLELNRQANQKILDSLQSRV